jgi:tetratricopeptide (TPR) repeat protein
VALNTGDLDKAIDVFGKVGGEDPKVMASHGQALWLKSLQSLAKNNVDPAKFGEELKKTRGLHQGQEILTKAAEAKNADAVFWLAEIEEWTEGADKAKARIQAGLQEFANDPTQKQRFEAAFNRLNLQPASKPAGEARLRHPGGAWIALALVAMQMPPMPPGIPPEPKQVAEQEEAGDEFWKAIGLAQKRQYPQALEALEKAQKVHARMRLMRPKQQQNRAATRWSIFLTACDEIRQRWQLESASTAAAGLKDYDALAAELAAQKDRRRCWRHWLRRCRAWPGDRQRQAGKVRRSQKLKLADLAAAIKAGGLGAPARRTRWTPSSPC